MTRSLVSATASRGLVVAAGLAISASAFGQYTGPAPYLSAADSPFAALPFNSFFLENFEDGALNTLGLSVSGGVVSTPGPATDSVDADDGAIDGSGTSGHSWYSGTAGSRFSFSFNAVAIGAFPTHAGLVWTDVGVVTSGSFAVGDVSFEAFDAAGVSLGILGPVTLGDGNFLGGTAEDRFFGVVNAGGISRIDIFMGNSTDWEVDHVQYGVIPAPGAAAVGLAMLGATMKRRRNRA